jgi:glycosyltransferase involved in cell wall biosynthesis
LLAVILSWEFPPRIVGDIALYVNKLAVDLVRKGVDIHVVTYHDTWTGFHQGSDGVKVHRVANPMKTHLNILTWDLTLMTEFERAVSEIYYSFNGKVDVIDAQEWLCLTGAVALKKAFDIPFVYTIHSLEDHRSHNGKTSLNEAVKSIEWLGTYEAGRVVVGSQWMKSEVNRIYKTPLQKICVVQQRSPDWVQEVFQAYEKATVFSPAY